MSYNQLYKLKILNKKLVMKKIVMLVIIVVATMSQGFSQKNPKIIIQNKDSSVHLKFNVKSTKTLLYAKIKTDSSGLNDVNNIVDRYKTCENYITVEYGVFLKKFKRTEYFDVDYTFNKVKITKKKTIIKLKNNAIIGGTF